MRHGIDISTTYHSSKYVWTKKTNLTVLLNSGKNWNFYKWIYRLPVSCRKIVGIPKHQLSKSKLKKESLDVLARLTHTLNLQANTKFITLASRPADNINYCTIKSRNEYLLEIGKFLKLNPQWHLLIKNHPKEQHLDEDYWSKSLELSKYSSSYSFTNIDIMNLACVSEFGLSFFSSCCIDFAMLSKPMIEMTSPNGTLFGDLTYSYDFNGNAQTSFAQHGLTISAKSSTELSFILNNISSNLSRYSENVNRAYIDTFRAFNISEFVKML